VKVNRDGHKPLQIMFVGRKIVPAADPLDPSEILVIIIHMSEPEQIELNVALDYRTSTCVGNYEESGDFVLRVNADVVGTGFLNENSVIQVKLGELKFFRIQVGNVINYHADLFDVLDCKQEISDVGKEIYEASPDGYIFKGAVQKLFDDLCAIEDLLILHRLAINPLIRGQRLGLAVLHRTIEDWSSGCGLVAMKPYPLQFEYGAKKKKDWSQLKLGKFPALKVVASKQLRNYYERLGFKRIGRSVIYAFCSKLPMPSLKELGYSGSVMITREHLEMLPKATEVRDDD
jgi:GNAT superfamily N-acetyltransferase